MKAKGRNTQTKNPYLYVDEAVGSTHCRKIFEGSIGADLLLSHLCIVPAKAGTQLSCPATIQYLVNAEMKSIYKYSTIGK